MSEPTQQRRDYAMFDAELSGAVLNLALLRRLLGVAQLPLDAELERKAGWVERALADLEVA